MSISLLPLVKLFFNDNNPGVTKLKNTQYDSVYVCECKSMLRKERHYMFVIGSVDVIPIGSNVQIEDINNISCIQFRTFQEPLVQQVLVNYIDFDSKSGQVPIKRYNISQDKNGRKISEYMFQYGNKPYNVHIFHTTDSDYEFVPEGNLLSALITWDTMIMASIDIGAPPTSPNPSPPQYRNGGIPPLSADGSSLPTNNELLYERRARSQVRPGRNTIQSSLPPPMESYQSSPPISNTYIPQQGTQLPVYKIPISGSKQFNTKPRPRPSPSKRMSQCLQVESQRSQENKIRNEKRVSFNEPNFNPRPLSRSNPI